MLKAASFFYLVFLLPFVIYSTQTTKSNIKYSIFRYICLTSPVTYVKKFSTLASL